MKKLLKYAAELICACILSAVFLAIYDSANKPDLTQEHVQNPTAVITFRNGSVMEFELYPTCAPDTVGSFVSLANSGFYDGLDLNLVVAGAFAKGGDPAGDGTGTAGYTIAGEFSSNGVNNPLKHTRGTLSLARREDDPNSGSCQFFIMQGDYPEFDGYYAAFGRMTNPEGYDLLDEICSSVTDSNGTPIHRWTIRTLRVETYGAEYPWEVYIDPDAETTDEPESPEEAGEDAENAGNDTEISKEENNE